MVVMVMCPSRIKGVSELLWDLLGSGDWSCRRIPRNAQTLPPPPPPPPSPSPSFEGSDGVFTHNVQLMLSFGAIVLDEKHGRRCVCLAQGLACKEHWNSHAETRAQHWPLSQAWASQTAALKAPEWLHLTNAE